MGDHVYRTYRELIYEIFRRITNPLNWIANEIYAACPNLGVADKGRNIGDTVVGEVEFL